MPTATEKPGLRSIALGLFLVVNTLAILATNIAGYLDRESPGGVAERYVEATGQPQGWGMFESGYMRNSVAWDVRIELPDGRVERVRGVARLPDEVSAWNAPAALSRRFVYESSILGIDLLLPADPEKFDASIFIADVHDNNGSFLAFFRTIYARERKSDWPTKPRSMELVILRETIPDHQKFVRYVARWQPDEASKEYLEVEAYDLDAPDPPYRKFPR